jgi:hypothetical protein
VASQEETALLRRIQERFPAELMKRYQALIACRDAHVIAPDELQELIQLTDEVERFQADRMAALVELAQVRRTTLDQLLQELGIGPAEESVHE